MPSKHCEQCLFIYLGIITQVCLHSGQSTGFSLDRELVCGGAADAGVSSPQGQCPFDLLLSSLILVLNALHNIVITGLFLTLPQHTLTQTFETRSFGLRNI